MRRRLGPTDVAVHVACDEHAAVGDLEQAVAQSQLDRLAGEPGAGVVAGRLEADRPVRGDEARERAQLGRLVLGGAIEGRDRLGRRGGELEAPQRRGHADPLVGTLRVVVGDPLVERRLGLLEGGEDAALQGTRLRTVLWKRSTLPVVVGLRGAVSR